MNKKIISLILIFMLCLSITPSALGANDSTAFTDILSTDWYAEAVEYVTGRGIFNGTSATTFSPKRTITRAEFVTVLARLSNVDTSIITDNGYFNDISFDAYYGPSVIWAYNNGIVSGTGNNTFSPTMPVTREQVAVFLYRYLTQLGIEAPAATDDATYNDADTISDYAHEAVEAMSVWKFIVGDENGNYRPLNDLSRAEAAMILMRVNYFLENGENNGEGAEEQTASFSVTKSSYAFTTSVGDDDYGTSEFGYISINDDVNGIYGRYLTYYSDIVTYTFESSDESVIKVNATGGLYSPVKMDVGESPKTAYITVTNKNDNTSVKVTVTVSPSSGWYTVDDNYIEAYAAEVFRLVNIERVKANLNAVPLYADWNQGIANAVCELMYTNGFQHQDFTTILNDYPEAYHYGAECIAKLGIVYKNGVTTTSPQALASIAVNGWMGSEGHKDILLSPYGEHMVVGLYIGEGNYAYSSLGMY